MLSSASVRSKNTFAHVSNTSDINLSTTDSHKLLIEKK